VSSVSFNGRLEAIDTLAPTEKPRRPSLWISRFFWIFVVVFGLVTPLLDWVFLKIFLL